MEEKNIDESWKEEAEKEKEKLKNTAQQDIQEEPDFNFFVMTLAMQATIALGEAPNPVTKKQEQDLKQAKFLIDTLGILQEKTKGNLTDDESKFLNELLYGLRMSYLNKKGAVK